MKNNRARVSISRRGLHKGVGHISISITDGSSGLTVAEVEMDMIEFAECITGMGLCEAKYRIRPTPDTVEKYGKVKEVEQILIPTTLTKYSDKEALLELINDSVPAGWELWDNGMSSQQNNSGHHKIVICRYVDKEDDRERF